MTDTILSALRIAIVGAGPGGLTLARIFHLHGIVSTVFERDEHARFRPQGGSLDLHPDTGQLAIRATGLEAEFQAVARPEDQGHRLFNPQGVLLFEDANPAAKDRPEVDRSALRDILLASLPADTVRWGQRLRTVSPHAGGGYTVECDNGRGGGVFDLVVGADGAWSRVRPLVSTALPAYTGVTFIDLSLNEVDTRLPDLAELVGRGMMMAAGGGRAIVAQRNSSAHVRVYAMLNVGEYWATSGGLDCSSPAATRAAVAAEFRDWSPRLVRLIECSTDRIVPWPLYEMPVGHRWPSRPGVTLLGDAAHLMSPFGGQGVNFAMLDAVELAQALLSSGADWMAAVAAYEAAMCGRVEPGARGSAEALREIMSPEGLGHLLDHMATSSTS